MIETAKDSASGNLITIELKVCELAQTPHQTEQKRLPSSPSPNYERMSGSVHVAKNQPARRLDEEFTCSLNETTEDVEYESSTQKSFKKLEQQKHGVSKLSHQSNTKYLSSRAVSSRRWVLQGNCCVQIDILQGTTKLRAPLHPALLLQYVKRLSGILQRRNISRRGSPNSKLQRHKTQAIRSGSDVEERVIRSALIPLPQKRS